MAWISFGAFPCRKKNIFDDSLRLDVAEIARVPDMLPSLFIPGQAKDLLAPRYIWHFIEKSKVLQTLGHWR